MPDALANASMTFFSAVRNVHEDDSPWIGAVEQPESTPLQRIEVAADPVSEKMRPLSFSPVSSSSSVAAEVLEQPQPVVQGVGGPACSTADMEQLKLQMHREVRAMHVEMLKSMCRQEEEKRALRAKIVELEWENSVLKSKITK